MATISCTKGFYVPSPLDVSSAKNSLLDTQDKQRQQQINKVNIHQPKHRCWQDPSPSSSSTSLNMFMGSDGGILGIGTPELFTILLVGYFVLGPSDLYKLTKEIGKFIQNIRTLGTEATKTFENTMENQMQFDELRKAQRELNDAFSFRRSINVDDTNEAFDRPEPVEQPIPSSVQTTTTTETSGSAKKKRRRRRVKKQPPQEELEQQQLAAPAEQTTASVPQSNAVTSNVPDLDMRDAVGAKPSTITSGPTQSNDDWFNDDVLPPPAATSTPSWDGSTPKAGGPTPDYTQPDYNSLESIEAQQRFQAQLSNSWNDRVIENQDQLEPLAMIMEKLALLEEEKNAADARLAEEFRLREELEEKYYREKRQILEDTASEIQKEAYSVPTTPSAPAKPALSTATANSTADKV